MAGLPTSNLFAVKTFANLGNITQVANTHVLTALKRTPHPFTGNLAYHLVKLYISQQVLLRHSRLPGMFTMVKLIALYKTPADTSAFDSHYANVHTPLVKKIPGLRKLEVARITGAPIGEAQHYLVAEMYFDDQDSMQRSLATPEGKATARDLMSFAGSIVTMFHAEIKEP